MVDNFHWRAPEFIKVKRNKIWFFNLWAVVLALAFIFLAMANYFAVAVSLVAGFAILVTVIKDPKIVEITLTQNGLKINNEEFKFKEIKKFFLKTSEEALDELIFITNKINPSKLNIILDPQINKNELIEFLSKFIPQEEYQESLSDLLAKVFKF